MRRILLLCTGLFCTGLMAGAQYTTPTINGTIAANEYGTNNTVGGANSWYMTWDANNLYVAVGGSNVAEAAQLILDVNPVIPANGGSNANGNLAGTSYDNTQITSLPFRADYVFYFKNGYRDLNTANGAGGWSQSVITSNSSYSYAESGGNTREFAIPWSAVGGRPASFNAIGLVNYSGGNYNVFPSRNPSGAIGTNATYPYYNSIPSTENSTTSSAPFSRLSYTAYSGGTISLTGNAEFYDLNVTNATTLNITNLTVKGLINNMWVSDNSTLINDLNSANFSFSNAARVLRGGSTNITNVYSTKLIPAKTTRKSLLLASPISANLNSAGWQQQIHITGGTPLGIPPSGDCSGVPSGFDRTQTGASNMFNYVNGGSPTWQSIPDPSTVTLTPGSGYRVLVRGSRNEINSCNLLNGSTTNQNQVNLAAVGTLQTQPINIILGNGFNLLGNPYHADLDFDNSTWRTTLSNAGVGNKMWLYNPAINNNQGNSTVTWSTYNNAIIPGTSINMGSNPNLIANGQGFLVNRNTGSGAVTNAFHPDYISTGSARQTGFFRSASNGVNAQTRIKLNSAQAQQIDEVVIRYITHNDASNTLLTNFDSETMNTGTEMISTFKTPSLALAILSRIYTPQLNDTVRLNVKGIAGNQYQLFFSDFGATSEDILLHDKLTQALVSAKGQSVYTFTASAVLPSTERFEVIFRSSATLSARFTSLLASRQLPSSALIQFTAQEDGNVLSYEGERSTNGVQFEAFGQPVKASGTAGNFRYTLTDDAAGNASVIYYRIRANNAGRTNQYSQLIRLNDKQGVTALSLYPNPVKDQLHIRLEGQRQAAAGSLSVRITNVQGQVVYTQSGISAAAGTVQLYVPVASWKAGQYHVQILSQDGTVANGSFVR